MINQNLMNSWSKLNLIEQFGNIGSEVGRARKWQNKDENRFYIAVDKALELLDLTIRDKRWDSNERREAVLAKEVFCDGVLGGSEYKSNLNDIEKYFMQFAVLAQSQAKF